MAIMLGALLDGPLRTVLQARVQPRSPREIVQVTLLEDLTATEALRPGAIAVLSRASEAPAGGYQLDILVRQAAEHDVAAIVLRRSTRRSLTAESLAQRGRVALLDVDDDADPMQVLDWLAAAVSGDARAALARLAAAAAYEPDDDADPTTILDELSDRSGVVLALADVSAADGASIQVDVDGRVRQSVRSAQVGDAATVATRLAATTLSRVLTSRERDTLRPVRSRSSALSQILLCSQSNLAAVCERAIEVGLQVHAWHRAVRLTVDTAAEVEDEHAATQLDDDVVDLVARRPRDPRGSWTVTRPDASFVLIYTTRADPGRGSDLVVIRAVEEIAGELAVRQPAARFRAGIGTPHEGALGLRASADEARTAEAAARLKETPLSIATFDSLGLRRMLAEWLVTDTARETVSDLLAPLDALGPVKAAVAIDTLHAYLDESGSLQRAAARLNVHRNAVVYRMAQVKALLPNDLSAPDERFALQLACRARLMTTGRA